MPRIQPIDPATATGAVAAQLDGTRKSLGSIPNMFTTAAQSAATITALNGLFGALGKGALDGKTRERIAIAVAQTNGCEYCLSAHTALGSGHGLSAAELSSAKHGQSTDAKAEATMALALAIVSTRGMIGDAALSSARLAGLTDGEIVEVVANVALNIFTNYMNNVAQTDVDFPLVELAAAA